MKTRNKKIEPAAEINDSDRKEIARQIENGNTSGRIDSDCGGGLTKHISWRYNADVWFED